ncbi:MAG: DEAD/DEAH box helicase [Bdellovibrionota bacterium]|nr:DEAD/DEAH box helicase [Bdellovibrionota bacterium]
MSDKEFGTTFEKFDLSPTVMEALKKCGYKKPTPIQEKAIPVLKNGRDLLGLAQTGTGKTCAYSLPLLDKLFKNKKKARPARMRALILAPTRELATQIYGSLKKYGKGLAFSNACIIGGEGKKLQIRAMGKGVDILVATPGRLLDLIEEGHVLFNQLEFFVLDEADKMFDLGFIHDVKKIIEKLPDEKQSAFFSATMSSEVVGLSKSFLKNSIEVEVDHKEGKIVQKVQFVEEGLKPVLLKKLLRKRSVKSALVFTQTKNKADRVVQNLEKAYIKAVSLHGDKTQEDRNRALSLFKKGEVKVLVATDLASRGIDIPFVELVVNYDLPQNPECYIHRIGRTGRAGKDGMSVSYFLKEEEQLLKNIEVYLNTSLEIKTNY